VHVDVGDVGVRGHEVVGERAGLQAPGVEFHRVLSIPVRPEWV
jgi:hypothetical protein